jgi:hypothetical protein
MADERLETPKQLAERIGLSTRQVRILLSDGRLEHVCIGARIMIPSGAYGRFLERNTVRKCRDETKDRAFAGCKSENPSTLSGQSMAAAASARQARKTANKLKSISRSGSRPECDEPAQVIPLRS